MVQQLSARLRHQIQPGMDIELPGVFVPLRKKIIQAHHGKKSCQQHQTKGQRQNAAPKGPSLRPVGSPGQLPLKTHYKAEQGYSLFVCPPDPFSDRHRPRHLCVFCSPSTLPPPRLCTCALLHPYRLQGREPGNLKGRHGRCHQRRNQG